ncbi:hypothetical protein PGB90_004899 [Kerria lacca]
MRLNFKIYENDLKEDNNTEDNFISYSREYLSKNSELKDEDQFEHFLQDDENSLDSVVPHREVFSNACNSSSVSRFESRIVELYSDSNRRNWRLGATKFRLDNLDAAPCLRAEGWLKVD